MKRNLLIAGLLIALNAVLLSDAKAIKTELRCKSDGTFKIVMFSDTQDGPHMDPRTTALMERILDAEKPDMVVIGGDCISGGMSKNITEVKQAISCVAAPMEKRQTPWAIVFGNHDQEHYPKTHVGKDEIIKYYQSFARNQNVRGNEKIHGYGNDNLLIKGNKDNKAVFCLWLLDSGEYAPKEIGGYEWIHADQVNWYYQTSQAMETTYGHKIPGLMIFHIPLREFGEMVAKGGIVGDRCENESPANLNSGLFSALVERGDVKGVFCGHDHVNNYTGMWYGIQLGYDAAAGFAPYNLPANDPKLNRTHGGRVFLINETDPANYKTWMRYTDNTTSEH